MRNVEDNFWLFFSAHNGGMSSTDSVSFIFFVEFFGSAIAQCARDWKIKISLVDVGSGSPNVAISTKFNYRFACKMASVLVAPGFSPSRAQNTLGGARARLPVQHFNQRSISDKQMRHLTDRHHRQPAYTGHNGIAWGFFVLFSPSK